MQSTCAIIVILELPGVNMVSWFKDGFFIWFRIFCFVVVAFVLAAAVAAD